MRKHFNDLRNNLPDLSAFAFHHKIRILFIKRHAFRICLLYTSALAIILTRLLTELVLGVVLI